MEKQEQKRTVEVVNSFRAVWRNLSGRDVELETENQRTHFTVKDKMARRRGSLTTEEVLVFLREDGSKLVECSRCYVANWGFYFNNLGVGQRIGMFTRAFDAWVYQKS
jgi:hypothetical protein